MSTILSPSSLTGVVAPPASKSMMQRVCAAATLNHGETIIYNPGTSNDDNAALSIAAQLGAEVLKLDNYISIKGKGIMPAGEVIDCGESGLSTRLFTPIAALATKPMTITGHGSLLQRPMTEIGKVLPELGVSLTAFTDYLPIHLSGPVKATDITMDGSLSSQYLTGVLFALAFTVEEPVTVTVNNLTSKPYIDLSIEVLHSFGRRVVNNEYKTFTIYPVAKETRNLTTTIETDWSSAVAWVVAGAIKGPITIENLNVNSTQADKEIIDIAEQAGAILSWTNTDLTIAAPKEGLIAFSYNATEAPDLFPVLSILAASCTGTSKIEGLHRLTHKESNRSASVQEMLTKFGVPFSVEGDSLMITGVEQFKPAVINSYNDHRLVMAAAVATLRCSGTIEIETPGAVAKSYPAFFEDFVKLSGSKTLAI